ncbi:retinol-binding protein pinta [Leptinotarsa decemlineata]|uniref:retinol-binding protein pinta n=1 Tax=Leptinotarsa decemlineata TaxID=7539 RepID=UPI003D30C369
MTDIEKWLTANKGEVLEKALKKYDKTEKQLEEDVRTISKWLRTQHHLPEIPSENHVINSLLLNKLSIENSKKNLDLYYSIRTLLPEVFEHMTSENILKQANRFCFLPLPKRTPEGDRITLVRLMEPNSELDLHSLLGYCVNIMDLRLREDICTSEIIIDDLETIKLSHLPSISPIHMKKIVMITEKMFNNRVKQIHILNCPQYLNPPIRWLKNFLKPKIASRIFFHNNFEELGKYISLELLPKEFGGSESSIIELNDLWKKKLTENADRFDALVKMKIDEKLRPEPLVNDEILGFHGNFKNLDVD